MDVSCISLQLHDIKHVETAYMPRPFYGPKQCGILRSTFAETFNNVLSSRENSSLEYVDWKHAQLVLKMIGFSLLPAMLAHWNEKCQSFRFLKHQREHQKTEQLFQQLTHSTVMFAPGSRWQRTVIISRPLPWCIV